VGTLAHEQVHHDILADTPAAERQNVDRTADGPHHVVIEKGCEGGHVAVRQGIIKCLNDCAPDWTAHLAFASGYQ
jgi:hypothetical protein